MGVDVQFYSFFNLSARWGWVVNAKPQLLDLQKRDPVPIAWEARWAPPLVWLGAEILAPPPGFDTQTTCPVVSHYTNYTIPPHQLQVFPPPFS